jgi:membrane-bound ClpP family serine protease
MVEIGLVLAVIGATLLVAEAHLPGGVLGATGTAALAVGVALAIGGAGAGTALVVAAVLAAAAVAGVWLLLAARKSFAVRRLRAASGREALSGRSGVVRSWTGNGGQVFVDGALWRACRSWPDDEESLDPGDAIVVERVTGLTLGIRKAEDWELHA